jgi:LysR family carnitine catabolism transcriptional activator
MLGLQTLRIFVAVVEGGGIRGAAERLSRTASAVSMSLKQLEQDVGAPLFEGERKTALTPLGRLVLAEGRDVLQHFERSRAAIYAMAGNERTRAEIACIPSVAVNFLPDIVRQLATLKPAVHLHARDMDSRSVRDAVSAGVVDVGVGSFSEQAPGLSFAPLYSDRLALLCRSDSPLASLQGPLCWRDLAGQPFLAHGGYGSIDDPEFFALEERAHVHLPNVMSLFALVKAGAGVTILPRLFEFQSDKAIRFLPLADPNARQVIGVISRSAHKHAPATLQFLKVLDEVVRDNHRRLGLVIPVPED